MVNCGGGGGKPDGPGRTTVGSVVTAKDRGGDGGLTRMSSEVAAMSEVTGGSMLDMVGAVALRKLGAWLKP